MQRTIEEMDIGAIRVKPHVRRDLGDLTGLEQSIRKLGLLQPVLVDRSRVLVAGARRLEACRRAGLSRIPVVQLEIDAQDMTALDVQADENLCREALSDCDLEQMIRRKKALMGAETPAEGVFSSFRKLFSKAKIEET